MQYLLLDIILSHVWSIGIVNPNCTGSETSVFNCSHNQTGSCSPSRDASVICQSKLGYIALLHFPCAC